MEVIQAFMQSYMDETTPRAKLLQWRIEASSGRKVPIPALRAACQSVPGLKLDPADPQKSHFVVLLESPPVGFQGFTDEMDDPIPELLWEGVGQCLEKAGWPICSDADHQPVVIADWIRRQNEELKQVSLGRCLAIVHQAFTTRKLLGKRRGRLVPYRESEECERHRNMRMLRPTGMRVGERYVAAWPSLRTCLDIVLQESNGWTPISRLKPLFRERFQAELSETAFGHATIMELLNAPELGNSFQIEMREKGRHVLAQTRPLQGQGVDKAFATLDALDKAFATLAPAPDLDAARHASELEAGALAAARATDVAAARTTNAEARFKSPRDQWPPLTSGRQSPKPARPVAACAQRPQYDSVIEVSKQALLKVTAALNASKLSSSMVSAPAAQEAAGAQEIAEMCFMSAFRSWRSKTEARSSSGGSPLTKETARTSTDKAAGTYHQQAADAEPQVPSGDVGQLVGLAAGG